MTDIFLASSNSSKVAENPSTYHHYFSLEEPLTIVGLALLAILMALSTLSGVSGSHLILPILLIFFKFEPKYAISHTSTLATLSCVIRIMYEKIKSSREKEPQNLINFHLVMIGATPAIFGAFVGVNLNHTSPEALIIAFSTLLQVALLIFSFQKFLKKRKEENEEKVKAIDQYLEDMSADKNLDLLDDISGGGEADSTQTLNSERTSGVLMAEQERDSSQTVLFIEPSDPATDQYSLTLKDAAVIGLLMLINPIITKMRSDSSSKWYHVQKCSTGDLYVLIGYLGFLIAIGLYQVNDILNRNKLSQPKKNTVNLGTKVYCLKFAGGVMGVSFVGGFLASGSSALLSMFMISLEIYPFIASSTTLLLAVIFSGSSSLIYALTGKIYLFTTLVCGAVVVLSTILTRMTLYQAFLKHGRASLLVLFIAISLGFSIPANIIQVYPSLEVKYRSGNLWTFYGLCPK